MKSPLSILQLEDNPNDAELTRASLSVAGIACNLVRVETRAEFQAAVEKNSFDMVLADYSLPSFDGLSALKIARAKLPDTPFIFVSGTMGEELAIETLKSGASDYVLKHRMSRLAPAVRRALAEAGERVERKKAQDELGQRAQELAFANQKLLQMMEALERLKEKAEESTRLKSEFLTNVSHELRTPMNAIIGMTDVVLDTGLTREQRDNLAIVRDSAAALLSIINDILEFSQIEAGKVTVKPWAVDLHQLVADAVTSLRLSAYQKHLDLICDLRPELPAMVITDPRALRQILINLVNNAIKFTTHGEIAVRVELRDARTLEFCVSDTGIGIAPDQQKKIFEAFVQADGSLTRAHGGTGLGLSISMHLVRLLGGSMWLESQPGRGSKFHFTIESPLTLAPGAAEQRLAGASLPRRCPLSAESSPPGTRQ